LRGLLGLNGEKNRRREKRAKKKLLHDRLRAFGQPPKNAKRGAWRLPARFFRSRRDAEGVAGGAHRKSGVKTASISNYSARWSHTNPSVHYDYNSLLLPRIGECNWKIVGSGVLGNS